MNPPHSVDFFWSATMRLMFVFFSEFLNNYQINSHEIFTDVHGPLNMNLNAFGNFP